MKKYNILNPKLIYTLLSILVLSLFVQFTLKAAPINNTQHYLNQAEHYLDLADTTRPPQSYEYELLAADLYIKAGALPKAEALLEALPYASLPAPLREFKDKISTEFALKTNHTKQDENQQPKNRHFRGQPLHVALLLPLTGPHAKPAAAIKQGFLAQYEASQADGLSRETQIRLYDTTQTSDTRAIYQQAVRDGADFVVGPLIKNEVYQLSRLAKSGLPVPVLALNVSNEIDRPLNNFFQFALSPEEEAEHLADKAWTQGHRSTSIVVPDNDWGKRVLNAFSAKWRLLGGKISSVALINPKQDEAAAIRKLLGVADNHKPKNQLKNNKKEAENPNALPEKPNRRQDIDMIVLAAPPAQARQLRPLLDFYYANDLTIYATSSIYEGSPDPKKDRDLNGVVFCDMPWILDNRQDNADSFTRLYAMGLDAYQLISKLKMLVQSPDATYRGATGNLSVGAYNKIERELSWAQIKEGQPRLL